MVERLFLLAISFSEIPRYRRFRRSFSALINFLGKPENLFAFLLLVIVGEFLSLEEAAEWRLAAGWFLPHSVAAG